MDANTTQIIEKGISCLHEHLGLIEMETFISAIQREKFDYTKWHQHFADTIHGEELDRLCKKSAEEHPFHGNAQII